VVAQPGGKKDSSAPAEEQATFNTRLPKRIKNALQRAAELRGQTLSEFVLGSAYDRALQTIAAETILQLSERDSEAFARALTEAPVVDDAVLARFLDAHRRAAR
jgi:uncharacterized protein (DUF1778 family)